MIGEPAFYLLAVPAVVLFGLAKGGFAGLVIVGMSLMAQVMSPLRAAAITLPILMVQDLVSLWAYRRHRDAASLVVLLPGAALGVAFGAATATVVSDATVRLLIGGIAVLYAANHFLGLGRRIAESRLTTGAPAGVVWSAVSGFASFVSHAGGPPYQVWMLSRGLGPEIFAGTTAWYFAAVNLMKAPFLAGLGLIDTEALLVAALLTPVAVASTLAGVWLVRITPAARYVGVIHALMLVVGATLLLDGAAAFRGAP